MKVPRQRRFEITSTGIDEAFQFIGSDPYGGISNVGLRVPFLPTHDPRRRYLFNLASFKIAEGARARIVGYRMGWTLGVKQAANGNNPPRVVEQIVRDPFFHLSDANISWHMRLLSQGEPNVKGPGPLAPPLRNLAFQMSDVPALLYKKIGIGVNPFYVNLTDYTPPNLGRPWGRTLQNNFSTFYDLRTQWDTHGAWSSLDVPVSGPCTVAFFASVRQSDSSQQIPTGRVPLVAPNPFMFTGGLSPEEQFLQNFPRAQIWRVCGALAVELDYTREREDD